MLVLDIQFTAGRYHATPWGRHVNEGTVEWPPSPFRIARALVDAVKRRRREWNDERLQAVLQAISSPPSFWLPPARASHIRCFLSSNAKDPTARQKVFDAFVALDRNVTVRCVFPVNPDSQVVSDLRDVGAELSFLGRSESWVRIDVTTGEPFPAVNCTPIDRESPTPANGEIVRVACLRDRAGYDELSERPPRPGVRATRGKPAPACSWIEAICLDTGDLLKGGWNHHPAMQWVDYIRPPRALQDLPHQRRRRITSEFTVARYAISAAVLPRITNTLPVAEQVRVRLMGIHRRIQEGDPTRVSPLFSGKAPDSSPLQGHRHCSFWPLDEDGDGRIDHIIVRSPEPFDDSELLALDRLRKLWQTSGRPDADLVLTALHTQDPISASKKWGSVTPFVTTRHHRRGRGAYIDWIETELRRECSFHGMPEPVAIEHIPSTVHTGHGLRWMEFIRSRRGNRPLQGHGLLLTFDQPVSGPFALGSLSHFGLGLFLPLPA